MKRQQSEPDYRPVIYLLVLLWLCSCATVQAISDAPVEFWLTLETLLEALWADVVAIADLLL